LTQKVVIRLDWILCTGNPGGRLKPELYCPTDSVTARPPESGEKIGCINKLLPPAVYYAAVAEPLL
jgi:hypothetical protein